MNTNSSRTRYAFLNLVFNMLYQVINTVVNIIIPPLIISRYGSIINGLISTIKQILGYIQLVGAGISESTVVSLYKPLAVNDEKKISGIFNACSKTFFRMGILFNIGTLLLAIVYPFFIKEDINYFSLVLLILVLGIAGASEFFVIGKCRSLLIADQKVYIVNIAQIIGAISNLIITIFLISINANIIIVQFGASTIYAARLIVVYSYIKKHYKFIDKSVDPDFSAIDKRKAATIHQLSGLVTFGSQTIIVSLVCGLSEASVYSVYNLVFTGINTILSTISSALLATFGNIIANDDKKKLISIYTLYETFYYLSVFILYSVTYLMILSFVQIYTNGAVDVNYYRPTLATLFCVMGIINCLRAPGATLINAIGHYSETKNRAIIEMLICFFLEIILVNFFGANGVIFATIIAYLYRTIDVLLYSNHIILSRGANKSLKKIGVNSIIFILIVLISKKFHLNVKSFSMWIIVAFIVSMTMFSIYLFFNYFANKDEYRKTYQIVKNKLRYL